MKNIVYGFGINDSNYPVMSKSSHNLKKYVWSCHFYVTWKDMIKRAYFKGYKEKKKTYLDVSVCEEWRSFMAFREWMITQDWEGKQLDKDILKQGNKIYSPESCIFITLELNSLFTLRGADRGDFPIGVGFQKGKYRSRLSVNAKRIYLGRYDCAMQAHAAWQKAKAEYIEQMASEQTDLRIKNALMLRVHQLRDDMDNGRETIKL